jgi:hydrogenase expression/formation protein HypE
MKKEKILLDHGSGGKMSNALVADLILPAFDNPMLSLQHDGAVFEAGGSRFAFSTDSYVVDPIFFPGGNIGDLAINGTVNDIAMCGAKPQFISVGLIIEEGFFMSDLEAIIDAMKQAAQRAGVFVVTGDTKVVPKGGCDGIFINTSGVGLLQEGVDVSGNKAKPGDRIILSGSIADHGIAILSKREGLAFDADIESDSAPLNHLVEEMIATKSDIHVLRDPTRGGAATALNEIAVQSGVGIAIREEDIPVRDEVAGLCELLGFDPLYIANEGKLLAFVDGGDADATLSAMRQNEFGKEARIIGEVVDEHPGRVYMETRIGGKRIVDMLSGEQLPRIC